MSALDFPAALYAAAHDLTLDQLEPDDVTVGGAVVDAVPEMHSLRMLARAAIAQKGPRSPVLQYQISNLPPSLREWIDAR